MPKPSKFTKIAEEIEYYQRHALVCGPSVAKYLRKLAEELIFARQMLNRIGRRLNRVAGRTVEEAVEDFIQRVDVGFCRRIGVAPCNTPACGRERPMETNGPADITQVGRFTRLMCQRCGGNWGHHVG